MANNQPDRFESFILPDGHPKITVTPDTKIPNSATIVIYKEDHTIANLIKTQLLKDKRVLFAGYKIPHPLEYDVVMRIQTTGATNPLDVLMLAITALQTQITRLKSDFEMSVHQFKERTLEMGAPNAEYANAL
ncbi:DNA-directed RNA polymerase [Synchytrium endobioticum]|uniref:DNA-directed RNA polymerase n=1 Tax=Synchytrium endobioticum TaxID=286115 RepID=A0A507DPG8_9FUNG|nr:DNA-directed RNA polymerase [Synchytrium endobioticum]TPX53145.1 DNA-directed RNA polymerase [Synchytrium endobioticum]